ncbi:MAG: Holliday junction branch migration protein RuvA, partial [Fimbriimonadaceae bacterium]|nr:Holliday junction branch migration protein RuvA [Fimbriimonadaceae bacterium]
MIGRLRGELLDLQGGMAVVDAGGVGYEVSIPESLLGTLPAPGSSVELWTRQVFREDGVFLYGFGDAAERRLFDLLV